MTGPACRRCGASGNGVQFSMFSPHGFGTFCVPCENHLDARPSGLCANCNGAGWKGSSAAESHATCRDCDGSGLAPRAAS